MFRIFIAMGLVFLCSSPLPAEKPDKLTRVADYLAVFDLEVVGSIDPTLARPLTESIRGEVIRSGKFRVMERGQMDKILQEQAFQMTGCVTKECMVEAGQLLGVGKIVIGTLGLVGRTYHLSLSQVNVETGETERMAIQTCRCEPDELIGTAVAAARQLLGDLTAAPHRSRCRNRPPQLPSPPTAIPSPAWSSFSSKGAAFRWGIPSGTGMKTRGRSMRCASPISIWEGTRSRWASSGSSWRRPAI